MNREQRAARAAAEVAEYIAHMEPEERDDDFTRAVEALLAALPGAEPEPETTWRQTICKVCGQDIEGDTAAEPDPRQWRDRGNGWTCLDGHPHSPVLP